MRRITLTLAAALLAASCYVSLGPGGGTDAQEDESEPDATAPPYTIDFVIENALPETCSSCVLYVDHSYGWSGEYRIEVTYNGSTIAWHTPFCTPACSSIDDPIMCCVDCGAPLPAVKQLLPGERVTVSWNGMQYATDTDFCECGCYRETAVGPGSGTVKVCAYESFLCVGGTLCTPNDQGVITMAEVSGEPYCTEESFSFPGDSGGEVVLEVMR